MFYHLITPVLLDDSPIRASQVQLQCSCLENPMDGGAWWAAVHGVTKSQTGLSDFTFMLPHTQAPPFIPGVGEDPTALGQRPRHARGWEGTLAQFLLSLQ